MFNPKPTFSLPALPGWILIFVFSFVLTGWISSTIYYQSTFAQTKLFIERNDEDYSLGKYIALLEDKGDKLNINEAASDSMKNKYVYYHKETLNLRFTRSAFWLRFVVVDTLSYPASGMNSQNNKLWLLVKNEPIIEDIRVYYRDLNTGGNKFIEKRAGSVIPVHDKFIKLYDFIAGFPVQKNLQDTIYLRVKTKSQFIISFNMLTAGEYVIRSSKRNFFHGILLGIFFLLIAYNTLLYFSIKEKLYLFYVLYIFSYALFIFIFQGYYFDIIGRTFYQDYYILPMIVADLVGIFWLLLTREFIATKLYLPRADKLLLYSIPLAPITSICVFIFASPWMAGVWAVSLLGYYILGFVIAVIAFKKGSDVSKYYLLALSGMTFGVIIFVSTRNNFLPLPYNLWTQNAINFGILWEALVLAAAVGYRFKLLKAEKEKEKARKIEELTVLNDIATAVSTSQSLEEIESLIIKKCIKHLSVEEGVIMLLSENDDDKPFQTMLRSHNSIIDYLPFKLDDQLMGWILKNETSIVVNNFAEDDRFYKKKNQNVALKSLIAVPMFIKSRLIGTIVLFNKLNGDFTNDDQRLLSICASQSAQVIESARLYLQENLLSKLKEEMNFASVIQKNLLPKEGIIINGYSISGISLPAKEVGGDFYDFIQLAEDKLAIWLGDVSGKGITAALLMANLQGVLRSRSIIDKDCRLCLEYTNNSMVTQSEDDKFATLFYSILDVNTNQLRFVSAGDNELVHLKHTGELEIYNTADIPIGIYPSYEFKEKTLDVEPGDTLVIYSDGLTEQENSSFQQFGKKRFLELIQDAAKLTHEEFFEHVFAKLNEFSDNQPQWDDQTMLLIKLN